MYILLESSYDPINTACIAQIDCMGSAETEQEAMEWRNKNIDYRTYKYVRIELHAE